MANPYDLYVKFLITKGNTQVEDINPELLKLNLPKIMLKDFVSILENIERSIPPGVFEQIKNQRYSVDFMKWMRELGLEEFWLAEPKWSIDYPNSIKDRRLVLDIHSDIMIRRIIDCFLLKNVPYGDILRIISGKYSIDLKDKHLVLYKKYFFNAENMTRGDWRLYLEKIEEPYTKRALMVALTEPLDNVKTELGLPAQVNVSNLLQDLLSKSAQKAQKYLQSDTPQSNKEARAWISQIMTLTDKYTKHKSADQTDFAKSLQLEFEYIETEFPTPDNETLSFIEATQKKRDEEAMNNKKAQEAE